MALIWTPRLQYPAVAIGMENPSVSLGSGVAVSLASLLTIAAAVVVYAALFIFFRYTGWGVRMRAVGENPRLAAQRGIAPHGPLALAWGIAALTGGLAGMLLSVDTGIDEAMAIIGLKTFPVVLVGGLDSLAGAIIGALVVAAAEILAIYYVDPLVADVAPFLVLLAILMVRPWGLFGTREELDRV
jgi:branched-chain amino acid transport system permease protein